MMTVRRFMIQSRIVSNGTVTIAGDLHNHISRVLRLVGGDCVQLIDENGIEYYGNIELIGKKSLSVKVVSMAAASASADDAPRITICQALPKGDKVDLILQKGTELGAHDFRLFGGQRSVARVRNDQLQSKCTRWNRITSEASRQCGRSDIPEVAWLPDAAKAASEAHHLIRLVLWENERDNNLKATLSQIEKPSSAIVAIGPEGGFTPDEIESFLRSGFQPVSLGTRILRTETAAIAILAILQYMWNEL